MPTSTNSTKLLNTEMREQFEILFNEFVDAFLTKQKGQRHIKLCIKTRKESKENLKIINKALKQGQDITDLVLEKLLPHQDTEHNRNRGAWIHVAPAITKDLKLWFGNIPWAANKDWAEVAKAVYEFVLHCSEKPQDLEKECKIFRKNPETKGLQSGFLSPVLNSLNPDHFIIINKKPVLLINYFTEKSFTSNLEDYPAINTVGLELIGEMNQLIAPVTPPEIHVSDVFDMFSHWLKAIKKFWDSAPVNEKIKYWQIAPGREARFWDDFRKNSIAAVGYSKLNFDLSHKNKEELLDLYKKNCPEDTPKQIEVGLRMLWYFRNLKPGDKFVTNRGRSLFLGLGVVKSGYDFKPNRKEYKHTVGVDYYKISEKGIPIPDKLKGKFGKTITPLKKSEFETLEGLFSTDDSEKDKVIDPAKTWEEIKISLTLNNIGQKLKIDNLFFENLSQIQIQIQVALQNNKNIILIGPPGTGKSKLAVSICEYYCGLNNYIMSTATSDWSTFETIGGYRPDKEGELIFYPGIFLQCFQDKESIPINKWLIIDEINRADIDKAFGSFFSALTGDDITLPFDISGEQLKLLGDPKDETLIIDNQFIIHPHWRIIATMNTFDKTSLYEMSYAFMRRFAFIPVDVPKEITPDLIKTYLNIWEADIDDSICEKLSELWIKINSKRKIGPAIIKDLYNYVHGKYPHDYVSGIIMYVLPQFEGLLEETQIEFIKELDFIKEQKDELIYFASDFFGLDIRKFE